MKNVISESDCAFVAKDTANAVIYTASTLKETVALMLSPDYKQRFIAEYCQTYIRYLKLGNMITKAKNGTLDFEPTCSLNILEDQLNAMDSYLYCLEQRGDSEDIDLCPYIDNLYNLYHEEFVEKEKEKEEADVT